MRVNVFVLIVGILISLLYLQYYYRFKQDYQILQVYLDAFKLNTLYEKYPIVIYDQVYDIRDLLKTIFAYSFVFKVENAIETGKVYRNAHKFLLVYSDTGDVSIKVINPKYKKDIKGSLEDSNVQFVTIKLKEKQVLILPALWYYHTDSMDVQSIGLDDIISKWLYNLF